MLCWEICGPGFHVDATLHTTADQVHPLMSSALPSGSGAPCHTKETQERPKEQDKNLSASTWHPIPQIPIPSSIHGTCRNKSNGGPSLQPTGLKGWDASGARDHRTPTPLSQPNLIHCGASLDWTCSSMSHGCSILGGEPSELSPEPAASLGFTNLSSIP